MLNNHNQYLVCIWFFTWLLSLIYCIQGKYSPCLIFIPFYFRPFYPSQHGRNSRLVEFQCLILSLLKNNCVRVNSRWDETVCMCRGTEITQGENETLYTVFWCNETRKCYLKKIKNPYYLLRAQITIFIPMCHELIIKLQLNWHWYKDLYLLFSK